MCIFMYPRDKPIANHAKDIRLDIEVQLGMFRDRKVKKVVKYRKQFLLQRRNFITWTRIWERYWMSINLDLV